MSFLVLLLVLWIEKLSNWRQRLQRDSAWLRQLDGAAASRPLAGRPWLALGIWVVLPLVALALVLTLLQPLAYGWLALPVHLLVVVFALGRGDVQADLGSFRDAWRRGDTQGALHVAERDLGLRVEEGDDLLMRVQEHLVWQAYQSFFAVIFWYFLLGPVAALAYRLLALAEERAASPAIREQARQVRHAFDWVPVRVLAASFSLVGNFVAVSRVLLHELLNWEMPAERFVVIAGRAAGELPESSAGEEGVASLDALWHLLVRSAVLWYAGFALWTLFF
ncbi:regulatory signaling modulator protein AmpE [Metapseudomonas otitidis]|uniref:regulatory signaling modulator protein AmpE n=1 Tax=Metapseudomonas otitidis TaxID=319939 RepID=UPI001CA45E11|nr:regulatory signaling modulator protein AmpE [Pseudomonas otitidis]MDH1109071.1 regulatory signaling modulator protein AmpE [Pseudomonas otitidis]MDH1159833.1 regulatory signaling modulator protein AmpE [Pseudomonas otitidis]MDH1167330.1 regulatory signaling modulator protein AmpE [Pseudomonas otitidis]QZX84183.1 regulatory signaling modulator protein AmpE [Pseudomonas otitidis]